MRTIVHSGIFITLVAAFGLGLMIMSSAPVIAANGGNGNHYGWGGGNGIGGGIGGGRGGGRGGGGGGGPLPALGVTLLGQAVGAGGLYALWRRRRNARNKTKL